jgi:hypothetical protein
MTTYNFTTFDTAIQAKLNTATVNLNAQDYLLLAKAVQTAIEVSEGVNLLSLKGTANGVAGLDANSQVVAGQLLNALPSQISNSGKFLTTNGSAAAWTNTATLATISTTGKAYIGTGSEAFDESADLTSAAAIFNVASGADSYGQIAVHNSTATSSTDVIAYSSNGNDAAGWIDMGITGPTFDSETYGITGANDGYIFMSAPVGTSGAGNLVIATGDNGTENKIVFAAGGYASGNTQIEITPDENVHIEINTPSTSATTGALTVVGGVGIQGDMNIDGDVSIAGTITFGGAGTTVETANLSVTDPFVFVGTNNQADTVDLAFIGEYASAVSTITKTVSNKALTSNIATLTTSTDHTYLAGDVVVVSGVDATFNGTFNIIAVPTTTTFTYAKVNANVTSAVATGSAAVSARRKFSGLARDASDGVIKAFKDATTKPTSTINFSEAGLDYADVRVGGLTASSLTVGDVSATEIGYLDGVTSAIQTQLNAKANLAGPTFTGTVTLPSTVVSGSATLTLPSATGTIVTASDVSTTLGSYLTTSSAGSTYAPLIVTTATPTFSSNNYTLVLGDAHKILLASNSSTSGTVTVPLNSSVAYATGTTITITQTGSGQLTLTPTGGVTINSFQSQLKFAGQYASVQLIKTAENTWLAVGNLAA